MVDIAVTNEDSAPLQLRDQSPDEARARKREYDRARYIKNREKVLARVRAYRNANREEKTRYDRDRYAANRDTILRKNRAYRKRNRERLRRQSRAKYAANREGNAAAAKAYRAAHPEKVRQVNRDFYLANSEGAKQRARSYRLNHPERQRSAKQRRRALKKAVKSTFTARDWAALLARSKRCHWCRRPFTSARPPTHDHVVPLSKGGANSLENSVCACSECNNRKSAALVNPANGQMILL
jgi:5-methylcytosine-specific restriction endonuclease McrA